MTLLPAADRIVTPWRNGGGVTREIATFPPGAGMADFLWRVSIAEVSAAGPFSLFPGVDRILTVLEGQLALAVGGLAVSLSCGSDPMEFAGEIVASGRPENRNGVTVLNVMVRRNVFHAAVRRQIGRISLPDQDTLLFAERPAALKGIMLKRHDALLVGHGEGVMIDSADAKIILITLMQM